MVTKAEAQALLSEGDRIAESVAARRPKEHVPFVGVGLLTALLIPGFDLVDRQTWGWVTIAIAITGFVACMVYFGSRRWIAVRDRSPQWTWPAISAWMMLMGVTATLLDGHTDVAYTVAGIAAAIPPLAWGLRLRRTP
ncbi:hypothetical protein BH20ACT16_BH20ACT16_02050 [soil metagenome]|jgi:hypothetical protein